MRKIFLAGAAAICFSGQVYSANSAVENFSKKTKTSSAECLHRARLVLLAYQEFTHEVIEKTTNNLHLCVEKAEEEAKLSYKSASSSAKETALKNALRKYYTVWLSSLRGIKLGVSLEDTQGSYSRRLSEYAGNLREAETALEIEANL